MKRYKNYKLFIFIILILGFTIPGCNKYNELGMDLLPTSDILTVRNEVLKEKILAFTHYDSPITTDEGISNLIGSFNDSIFGNITADYAAQFRINSYPKVLGIKQRADSVSLFLYYRMVYGDTLANQKLKVYELRDPLFADTVGTKGGAGNYTYYQDVNLKSMAYTKLLGELVYRPVVKLDSLKKDTVYQTLRVKLDKSFGEKLMKTDSLDLINNDKFLQVFKGLYMESQKVEEKGGAILSMDAPSSSSSQAVLVLYYSYDSTMTDKGRDSLVRRNIAYSITTNSARVNRFTHDYSRTKFYSKINSVKNPDSLIYIQSTGGLKSKIFIDELTGWKDSVRIGINKAELIFQIDTLASQVHRFPPPARLFIQYLDASGVPKIPSDYAFSPTFYNGILNKTDWTYHFNITQHLQNITAKKENNMIPNLGFELSTFRKNSEANRVVLKGTTSKTGIKMIITYTKFVE